jgi:beta-hydroxyacyl-ACP dehydratase FabZ
MIMKEHSSSSVATLMNSREIAAILPHRYPILLVDRIIDLDLEENRIIGIKNVTRNEPFFQGHFPEIPLMPGVLVLEALAQTAGILVYQKKGRSDEIALLLAINKAKFRRPVVPGDVLELNIAGLHFSSKGGRVLAKALVEKQLAVEAEISFVLVNREQL